ncbi:arylsulfatase [Vibrio sp. vnigr-6D03]|uniref:sulfatase family protein n=1 Tax=Vibrio sp. vnigr-6D03 TaxID=2058088 RepID=UPI000C3256EB|nr:sulfatase [Vibrio sp. vnigr-6D03]PKF81662.1 arylsulfatase [Vibrio sp. vnigr-6D03]
MRRPNLLYVFPDQFRQMAMGFWQQEPFRSLLPGMADPVLTPNIDNFVKQATVVSNAVSNCPLCSPHRGSLLTGMYPNKSGVPLNCHSGRLNSDLPKDAVCFTDVLAHSGYNVGYIGKWHLDFPTANDPENNGQFVDPNNPAWDSYTEPDRRHGIDYWYGYGTFDEHKNPHYYDNQGKRHEPKEWSAKHEADKAIAYLNNNENQRDVRKPFALFVSMNPPHSPYSSLEDCTSEDLNLYASSPNDALLVRDNADCKMPKSAAAPFYFANVTGVDREFGRILTALKDSGEWENTLIVFTSDHGETLCSHGLNDAKNTLYNEAFNVPFLIKHPFQSDTQVSDLFLSSPDIMPTVLGLLGLETNTPKSLHGHNLAPYLTQQESQPESQPNRHALYIKNVDGNTNAEGNVTSYFPIARGIKTDRYSLTLTINRNYQLEGILFFDNRNDPYQLSPLSFMSGETREKKLLKMLAFELERIQDPWAELVILPELLNYPSLTSNTCRNNHD